MSANKEALVALHDALAIKFREILEGDELPSASELSVIRQFLKDNNIDVDGQIVKKPLQGIGEILPFQDPELPIRRTGGD